MSRPHATPTTDYALPVLVVGSGLGGSATAAFLAQAGIPSVVLERHAHPSDRPKAWIVSPRTMELLRELGIDDQVSRRGAPGTWNMVQTDTLREAPTGAPPVDDSLAISPSGAATCDQDILEDILRTFATTHGSTIEWGCTVAQVSDLGHSVEVHTENGDVFRGRYVVIAEGAHSALTSAAGITTVIPKGGEADPSQQFDQVLFRSTALTDLMKSRPGNVFMTPATGSIIFRRSDNRWQIQRQGQFIEDPSRAIAEAVGQQVDVQILNHSDWTPSAHSAKSYRTGNIFLVGDAAHSFPPSLGMGGNLAIADAHNLAWKLAWVIKGRASAGLLDTYEQERKPVSDYISRSSIDQAKGNHQLDLLTAQLGVGYPAGTSDALVGEGDTVTVTAPHEKTPIVGHRFPHQWVANGRSTIDLTNVNTFAVVGAGKASGLSVPYTQLPNLSPADEPGTVWLLRPDGHVAAHVPPQEIAAVLESILRPPAAPEWLHDLSLR